ncbi:hypothetical protein FA378_05865 [Pseudomonas aeruginosa]|nr:hypothetical protein [Pseudomonas aeruginosa]MCO2757330.1 hypothetical protein [Pseudomonas aeruginosa]MCO2763671.1 hypothetical protein [Pseudomonas aeruginosa]MCO2771865.1 hypothetical protein [Pseudomonas aeruginosa]HEK1482694.1 hypothetical protein [Pseudomonas aeruginosa]
MNKIALWLLSPSSSSRRDSEYRVEFESQKQIDEIEKKDNGEYINPKIEEDWNRFIEEKVIDELQSSAW